MRHAVPADEILKHVKGSKRLRAKIATELGRLTGGKTRLNAAERRVRALKAVQAREKLRKGKISHMQNQIVR
jgi:hypothetical protein